MKKNDLIELTIIDINTEGNGVGRHDNMAVFVPFTAVGDQIICRIVKVEKRYAFGIIDTVAAPSSARVDNHCPVFATCGGCSLRHIGYEAECGVKEGWVRENMRRIGGIEAPILPILPSPKACRYRNKAIYPIAMGDRGPMAGFYQRRSHRVVPHGDCLLQPAVFNAIREAVLHFLRQRDIAIYDEQAHKGLVRNLFLRMGEQTGEIMVCLVINGRELPHGDELVSLLTGRFPAIKSMLLNINTRRTNVVLGGENRLLYGEDAITDTLCGKSFALAPQSFYQVNHTATELLYGEVAAFANLTGDDVLLDLYCGVGTIGLSLADRAKAVIGVEIVPEAIANAKANAARNGVTHARFICADATAAADQLAREGIRPDVVVVDPPRKGLTPQLIATVAAMAPGRVVMVSCNSATAARDAAEFKKLGYETVKIRPVDMFPRSAHVECICLLQPMAQ